MRPCAVTLLLRVNGDAASSSECSGMQSHILLATALWDAVPFAVSSLCIALHVQSTGRFVGHSPICYWQLVQSTESSQQWEWVVLPIVAEILALFPSSRPCGCNDMNSLWWWRLPCGGWAKYLSGLWEQYTSCNGQFLHTWWHLLVAKLRCASGTSS